MGIAENKALVTKFWEAFSAADFTAVADMLSNDATWWIAGSTVLSGTYTKPQFVELLGQVTSQAPNGIKVTPTQLTAEGNRVSLEALSHGEITNGKTYQNIYHFMIEIKGGKLFAVREYLDTEHVTDIFG